MYNFGSKLLAASAWTACVLSTSLSAATLFVQTNLASDIDGLAANTDANLKNPWGISFANTSPFWVSDQVTGKTTLNNGAGAPQALVVTTPPAPTGQVFNSSPSFALARGGKALFIFDSLSGQIAAWNLAQGTSAVTEFSATDGSAFTGLALGNNGSGDLLL